ncbi:MAG TPA: ATP-dependent DNA ligase [Patescibacteria group bacterium]|jgi:DNA ligase-1|nr:ATP-dependent DNA ligase [Patescibacteria group bacterium]
MQFRELTQYFEKLETTSSRLSLIEILAQLFKETPAEEIEKIVYLIQGRLAPFFAPIEIGMAEKTVAESLANAYGLSREDVLKNYQRLGDMGLAAYELAKSSEFKVQSAQLTVTEVVDVLLQIANTKGNGTVEKRQTLLSGLLKKLDPISAKHLVRIPLGNTRLGIGDPTVLDALATAKLGDKSQRKLLEGAYNRTSDLGLIAKTLWDKGLPAVQKLELRVGYPVRSELCERLPNPEKVIEKMGEVDAQYKYDGFRVQLHKNGDIVRMFSRNLEEMTHMFPELTEAVKKQIKAKTIILDSEALAYNPESEEFLPFQETTKRRRKHGIAEMAKSLPLKAFVFDILYKDGESLIDQPLTKRMEILKEVLPEDDVLIRTKNQTVMDAKTLSLLLEDAISKGLEGLVIKKLESPYEAGARNFNWVKLKRHSSGELNDTIDCVILGYISGKGKRTAFGAGALLVGVYDKEKDEFVTVSKIGTGLTDEEWREIHRRADAISLEHKPARVSSNIIPSVWIEPKIVIEILADEITRSPIHTAGKTATDPGYALRFPRLVSFREADKKPEDATSVKELIEMYQLQGKQD